jgi:MraZ protein
MFQGATELALDAKGRFAIPTRHRDALTSGGGVVLTAHPDGCLLLYPRLSWEPIGSRLHALSQFDEQNRWWQRILVGFAEELEPDGSGRILVSPALRKYANLDKQALLMGRISHFELWDSATWEEKFSAARLIAGRTPPPGAGNLTL